MKGGRGEEEEEPVGTELDLSMSCSEGSHLESSLRLASPCIAELKVRAPGGS